MRRNDKKKTENYFIFSQKFSKTRHFSQFCLALVKALSRHFQGIYSSFFPTTTKFVNKAKISEKRVRRLLRDTENTEGGGKRAKE